MTARPDATLLSDCRTPEEVAAVALRHACQSLGVESGTFFRLADDGTSLTVEATHGLLHWRVARASFPVGKGICGWTAREGKTTIANDVAKDPRFNQEVDLLTEFRTLAALAVPVVSEGRVIGVLELINRSSHPFTEADAFALEAVASLAAQRLHALS